MIESFNGIFYFILILILIAGNAYYSYFTAFNTKNWLAKYGVDETELFPNGSSSYVLNNIKVTVGQGTGFSTAPNSNTFSSAGESSSPTSSNASTADIVSTTGSIEFEYSYWG